MYGASTRKMKGIVTGQKEMKRDKLLCVICGKDITRCMKIYPHGYSGGAYCYDCAEADKLRLQREKAKTRQTVKNMRKRGLKPTEIAERLGISAAKVYEVLTK